MLQIKNISKKYKTGELIQTALDGVSLNFRDNEFVSILGPSGSGKTTLLNIIGGLDRYDSGDLVINGISTEKYRDRDWDSYRNHTIGFVFQSYNLIPHQSILANVELALTISGISKSERRKRSKTVLEKVGLGDQLHKKPNQLSGGQMQRVAIARALVNNPDILLADEPTGALDSETSVQIMELLHEVAKDRLVVMVTHNPELAEQYSTRIVKLRDGKIQGDSNPFEIKDETPKAEHKNMGRSKMSFLTSLSLSFNNLKTKKGRTILTSFAGSIGIIGIALILALSSSVNIYIEDIQKETMASYPISISSETIDMTKIMEMSNMMQNNSKNEDSDGSRMGIYADYKDIEINEAGFSSVIENNLTDFKKYLDNPDSEIHQYLGENGIVYTYDVSFSVFSYDKDNKLINSDANTDDIVDTHEVGSFTTVMSNEMAMMTSAMGLSSSGATNFSEIMAGKDNQTVSQVITDNYDMLYGSWPEEYNQVVLVLDSNNSISAGVLYQLGIITADEYIDITEKIRNNEEVPERKWDYDEITDHTFYLVPECDHYIKNDNGTFSYISNDSREAEQLVDSALELEITGIIRPNSDTTNISTAVAYTSKLTDYIINHTNESEVVMAQESSPEINVLNGMSFEALDDDAKVSDAKKYISKLGISEKASLYQMIMYYSTEKQQATQQTTQQTTDGQQMGGQMMSMDETSLSQALDMWLEQTPDNEILLSIYDEYIKGSTYESNMESFGKLSYDAPSTINIYTDSFEDKEFISDCIENYNKTADENNQIVYTDYVKIMTSSLTSIIDLISYILIAFVAVSLVVSCIMIGIITHISVMERTKEIGILRAMGASKKNISHVFNAETFIIGCCSGIIGVGIAMLLTIPTNSILTSLLGETALNVQLALNYAVILVILSIIITMIGGLLPAKKAAKKDPVIALRTE